MQAASTAAIYSQVTRQIDEAAKQTTITEEAEITESRTYYSVALRLKSSRVAGSRGGTDPGCALHENFPWVSSVYSSFMYIRLGVRGKTADPNFHVAYCDGSWENRFRELSKHIHLSHSNVSRLRLDSLTSTLEKTIDVQALNNRKGTSSTGISTNIETQDKRIVSKV